MSTIMSKIIEVEVLSGVDENVFETYSKSRKPIVIKGNDIGPCVEKWTVQYLCEKMEGKEATVHVCQDTAMNFIDKNFVYKKLPFSMLVQRASEEVHAEYFLSSKEFYYFRSLGTDVRKRPSNIEEQYPSLRQDIQLPDFFPKERFFSSVMRIASAGMQLWTHYDVMDNFLIQVGGRKRVVLFPPSDALNLYLVGDKSAITNIDNPDFAKYPQFANVTRYECTLEPGDILFIPALWFHNVVALEFGVAVNVFWKHLDEKLYDAKDVYGNKDLVPAARSLDMVNRALKVLTELPESYRDFYARKLIAHIEGKALSYS